MSIEELHTRFRECSGACTDTRQVREGAMFFALKGPNFNANAFALKAIEAGCRYAVVDDASVADDDRFILVDDVLKTLQALARSHRDGFTIPVIAITGTNGKTTTKELVYSVLSSVGPTLATEGNLNNHIGVPLTLLRMNARHHAAIIEMGANKPGDIAELCDIADPTHGLITNIGKAHLEGFGDLEGVIRTKSELYGALRARSGTVFVNADDALLMQKSAGIRRVTYGTVEGCDLEGGVDVIDDPEQPGLVFHFWDMLHQGRWHVETKLIGTYNLPNLLAAACIGHHFLVPDTIITDALGNHTPVNNRSQFTDTGRNHLVLDAYNANPSSMRAALENFGAIHTGRAKLALLGGMKELGAYEADEHQALADLAQALGIEAIFIGPEFKGIDTHGGRVFPDASAALAELGRDAITGKLILVKGSRGTKLETLLPVL